MPVPVHGDILWSCFLMCIARATEGAQEHGHERLNHPVTERTFGFSGLIMNKEFKSKCLFFLMVPYSWWFRARTHKETQILVTRTVTRKEPSPHVRVNKLPVHV